MATPSLLQSPASPAPPAPLAPLPPLPPAQAATPVQAGTAVPGQNLPFMARDLATLKARRSELSRQLTSAEGRRNELVRQLDELEGAARVGTEQRIMLLDERILGLERDIMANGQALALVGAQSNEEASEGVPGIPEPRWGPFSSKQATAVSIVFTLFVLCPLALAAVWRIVTRPHRAVETPASVDAAQRLARLEQAVDTIAVEVERVSEGQRFMTRLMTDARGNAAEPAALAAGQRPLEPVRVAQGERVGARREG